MFVRCKYLLYTSQGASADAAAATFTQRLPALVRFVVTMRGLLTRKAQDKAWNVDPRTDWRAAMDTNARTFDVLMKTMKPRLDVLSTQALFSKGKVPSTTEFVAKQDRLLSRLQAILTAKEVGAAAAVAASWWTVAGDEGGGGAANGGYAQGTGARAEGRRGRKGGWDR